MPDAPSSAVSRQPSAVSRQKETHACSHRQLASGVFLGTQHSELGTDNWQPAAGSSLAEHAVIDGLVRILLFQGIGEVIAHFLLPFVPGPVIGLILLLAFLIWRGGASEGVEVVSSTFVRYLGVLFVPAAVGVVMYLPHLRQQALAITVALVVSVVATIAAAALIAKALSRGKPDAS